MWRWGYRETGRSYKGSLRRSKKCLFGDNILLLSYSTLSQQYGKHLIIAYSSSRINLRIHFDRMYEISLVVSL